jgi:hypothetical protein
MHKKNTNITLVNKNPLHKTNNCSTERNLALSARALAALAEWQRARTA